ncbi:hypothetical protein MKX01_007416, partial [Papaver californicum]
MSSFNNPHRYAQPSAPALPESYSQQSNHSSTSHKYNGQQQPGYLSFGYGYGVGGYPPAPPPASIYGEIIRSFHTVDKDRSGFIDEKELQEALSFGYQKFSLRTFPLLMFLPNVFAALWSCIFLIMLSVRGGDYNEIFIN